MQNLLIVENNLTCIYSLINCICKEILNIRLYNIALTGMEAIDIIKSERVDIIVLDLNLPDMNGIDIINFISKNNLYKYNSSIIIYTNETNLLTKVIKNDYVFCYCSKINSKDYLIKKIRELIDEKKSKLNLNDVKNQIKKELEKLNFKFSYIGTKYLSESIYECYLKKQVYSLNLSKDIYSIIAKKYNKSIGLIRADIFQAISMMYYETDENILSDYFNYRISSKPTTKEIIFTILQNLN